MVAPQCETVCGGPSAAATAAQLAALRSAGEIEFDGVLVPEAFAFTQVAGETHPLTLAGAVLDPLSTDFVESAPGTLQYVGTTTKRFYASYSLTFLWATATGGLTEAGFIASLIKNGDVANLGESQTGSGSVLNIGAEFDPLFGHSSHTLIELAHGDTLQVGIAVLLLAGNTFSINVSAMTLVAHEV